MAAPVSNLMELLRSLQPVKQAGVYVFALLPPGSDVLALKPIATMCEAEGISVVVREDMAQKAGLPIQFRSAWITLNVHSCLEAVGLTAAFASALGKAGISCNVIAGVCHDHIFVPTESADQAMAVLLALQQQAKAEDAEAET